MTAMRTLSPSINFSPVRGFAGRKVPGESSSICADENACRAEDAMSADTYARFNDVSSIHSTLKNSDEGYSVEAYNRTSSVDKLSTPRKCTASGLTCDGSASSTSCGDKIPISTV